MISCLELFLTGILLVIQTVDSHPTTVGSPLGTTPGNAPGTIPAGSGSSDSDGTDARFSTSIQALATVLAVLCMALTATTYAVLIGPGTRLLSTSKLPLVSIEKNLSNLLSRAWPDTSESADVNPGSAKKMSSDAIRLMYLGQMDSEQHRAARGVEQCQAVPHERISTPSMWLTVGSSATRSMVQLAVWEWVSLWMAVAMVISTVSYNGLLTNQRSSDSFPRLVVVMMYSAAFCVHAWWVWRTCRSWFSLVAAGASWSLLHKASFASVDHAQLRARLNGDSTPPIFRQVGKPAGSATYPVLAASLLQDTGILPSTESETVTDAQKSEANTVGDWQKRDITSTVESAKTALDGVVTNTMTMIGIIITTGFSVWTSRASSDTSQLGSLALLASLTLGAAAMFSSAVDLSVMESSFKNVLFLKEVMINGEASDHVQKRSSRKQVIGFTHGSVRVRSVKMRDLGKSTGLLPLIFFGPAFGLLPSKADHERQSAGAEFELRLSVRGKDVLFTTKGSNRHNTKADGSNVAAISVCFQPPVSRPNQRADPVSRDAIVAHSQPAMASKGVSPGAPPHRVGTTVSVTQVEGSPK